MKIWILNHYATNMFFEGAGRHHALAKYLIKKGHEVTIFCSNTRHNGGETVDMENKPYVHKAGKDGVEYVFVKASEYTGNGISRIKNMVTFYLRVKSVGSEIIRKTSAPDIIIASSVHPLTLVAGIQLGKKFSIPCICEIRDLWPETLVALNLIKREKLFTKLMYKGEHWIYKKADQLIFTMPGGRKYVKDRRWDNDVSLDKIHNINNGVDLEKFEYDKSKYAINDVDLDNDSLFKVIYAGSIRTANKIDEFVSMAEILENDGHENIKIIIYGDGDQRKRLEAECKEMNLKNIVFKGRVEKQYIPYILSKSDLNIVTDETNSLSRYGISWNKIFEYMASGKPVVVNYDMGEYNFVTEYNFGLSKSYENIVEMTKDVVNMTSLSVSQYNEYKKNARQAAQLFNYKLLADKLEYILEKTVMDYKEN